MDGGKRVLAVAVKARRRVGRNQEAEGAAAFRRVVRYGRRGNPNDDSGNRR